MKCIIEEGLTLDEAYLKAPEKNREFKIFPGFEGSLETRIITALVMNGVKIWIP